MIEEEGKETPKIKILLISAQSFLSNEELNYSPFLENVRRWITEAMFKVVDDSLFRIQDYQKHKDCGEEPRFLVELCLLTKTILGDWFEDVLSFKGYSLIILEECMALTIQEMSIIRKCYLEAKQENHCSEILFWIILTSSSEEFKRRYPEFEEFKSLSIKGDGLRSTLEIATLCNAFQTHFNPERYPSVEISAIKMWEGIPITHCCDFLDTSRFHRIKQTINEWLDPPERRAQLLIIDCEDSDGLFRYLTRAGVPVCKYNDYQDESDKVLFLNNSVEAIVCGAEWTLLIFHCKYNTFYSRDIASLVNKRIISKAVARVYFFTNGIVDQDKVLPLTEINIDNSKGTYGESRETVESNIRRESTREPIGKQREKKTSVDESGDAEELDLIRGISRDDNRDPIGTFKETSESDANRGDNREPFGEFEKPKLDDEFNESDNTSLNENDEGEPVLFNDQSTEAATDTLIKGRVEKLMQLISDYKKENKTVKTVIISNDTFRIVSVGALFKDGLIRSYQGNELYIVEEVAPQFCYLFNYGVNAGTNVAIQQLFEEYNIEVPVVTSDGTFQHSVAAPNRNSFSTLKILLDNVFATTIPTNTFHFSSVGVKFDIVGNENIEAMVIQFKDGK